MISGMEGERFNLISRREKMMEAPVVLTSAPTILYFLDVVSPSLQKPVGIAHQ